MVGATGFEPATSRSRTERSTRLSHAPTEQLSVARKATLNAAHREALS